VVRHRGGLFERAAVLEVRRDPRRPKRRVADLRLDVPHANAYEMIRLRADAAGVQPWPESARSPHLLVPDSLSRHMRASARRRAGLAAAI
jgi:hypothetical protein